MNSAEKCATRRTLGLIQKATGVHVRGSAVVGGLPQVTTDGPQADRCAARPQPATRRTTPPPVYLTYYGTLSACQ